MVGSGDLQRSLPSSAIYDSAYKEPAVRTREVGNGVGNVAKCSTAFIGLIWLSPVP